MVDNRRTMNRNEVQAAFTEQFAWCLHLRPFPCFDQEPQHIRWGRIERTLQISEIHVTRNGSWARLAI